MSTSTEAVSLNIPKEVYSGIEEIARRTGRDVAGVAVEMLTEAVKMRRFPGITFTDGASGRVARVAGTRIPVFQIVDQFRVMGESWERLCKGYHWLSEYQLRTALAYAEAYPEEIEERLRREEYWTPERVYATYPALKPKER